MFRPCWWISSLMGCWIPYCPTTNDTCDNYVGGWLSGQPQDWTHLWLWSGSVCLHTVFFFVLCYSTTMQIVWILFQLCRTQPFEVFYMVSTCVDGIWLQGTSVWLPHSQWGGVLQSWSHSVFCECHLPLPCNVSADKQIWSTTAAPPPVVEWQWGGESV